MSTLSLSKLSNQYRAIVVLGLLLFSLLGTQYLGFSHSVAHAGFQHSNTELSSIDRPAFGISHGGAACHLFDALTLASFITPDIQPSIGTNTHADNSLTVANLPSSQTLQAPYQSRAPPSLTL